MENSDGSTYASKGIQWIMSNRLSYPFPYVLYPKEFLLPIHHYVQRIYDKGGTLVGQWVWWTLGLDDNPSKSYNRFVLCIVMLEKGPTRDRRQLCQSSQKKTDKRPILGWTFILLSHSSSDLIASKLAIFSNFSLGFYRLAMAGKTSFSVSNPKALAIKLSCIKKVCLLRDILRPQTWS